MTSRKKKRSQKRDVAQAEVSGLQLTPDANASSPEASRDVSPAPPDADSEEEEDAPVSLRLILSELREVGRDVKDFRKDTKEQLREIRGELDKTNARIAEVESRVAEHDDKLQSTDELLTDLITAQEKLHAKVVSLETYSRRETLRVYGVPEGAESGSQPMINFVEQLLRGGLGIPSSTHLQIQRAHRALSSPPPEGSRPRSILVKFLCFTVKEEVLRLAWQKKGFIWNNNKIQLDHDYPAEIMARRREYTEARRALKERNLRFQTLYPARLKVFYEGGAKIYDTVEAATSDLVSRGIPVKVIVAPTTLTEKIRRFSSWQRAGTQRPRQNRGTAGYKEKLQVFRREDN